MKAKPSGAKGTFVKRIAVTSTMGPGVKIDREFRRRLGVVSFGAALAPKGRLARDGPPVRDCRCG